VGTVNGKIYVFGGDQINEVSLASSSSSSSSSIDLPQQARVQG
jgi:hypothetical protein